MKGTEEPSSDGVAWVTKEVLEVGKHHSTTLIAGDSVSVHFVARSVGHDAVLLDTRALCTDPFELRLGKAFVVPELEQAVESMCQLLLLLRHQPPPPADDTVSLSRSPHLTLSL
jgi:hypothetical protein